MRVLSRVAPERAAALAETMFLTPRRFPRPPAEAELLASARRISLGGAHADLAAWEWESAADPCVLLVHGWQGRGAQLGALVAPLTRMGLRVVTFDARAHGDSPGKRSSLVHFAGAIEQAARAVGPLHAIVTHSMGGAAALWANRPARLAERHVLVAPPVDLGDFTRTMSRALGLPEAVREQLHGRLGERFGAPIDAFRAEAIAAKMRGPLLVVHDEDDREVPIACGEAIAGAWPKAELLRTRGLGHQRVLRDPAVLATIVDFVVRGSPTEARLAGGA